MVLSSQTIRRFKIFSPFAERTFHEPTGTSFGLSAAGYDVRLDGEVRLTKGITVLGSTREHFTMPFDIVGVVHDKSTWARRGVTVQNTVIEPGWKGYLTLELLYFPLNNGPKELIIPQGAPIAQVLLQYLDLPTDQPYEGKYQNQERGPQAAR